MRGTTKNSGNFIAVLDEHLKTLPDARRVHYILDNDSTHTSAETRDWLASQEGRVRFHYTPKYASWLNQAEIALNCFSTYYLRGRNWTEPERFDELIPVWEAHYNAEYAHPFDWSFTRNRFHEWQAGLERPSETPRRNRLA